MNAIHAMGPTVKQSAKFAEPRALSRPSTGFEGAGVAHPRRSLAIKQRCVINTSYRTIMTKPVTSAPTITLQVRRLEASNVADYRELRLESLKVHPEAFGSSLEYEGEKPISWWAERP
jgi:hypothetical protein